MDSLDQIMFTPLATKVNPSHLADFATRRTVVCRKALGMHAFARATRRTIGHGQNTARMLRRGLLVPMSSSGKNRTRKKTKRKMMARKVTTTMTT
jgi:hypothetical protein